MQADNLFEFTDQFLKVFGREFRVGLNPASVFQIFERCFEVVGVDVEHHVRVHGDEAAVAVPSETGVARFLNQTLNRLIVQAEVQNRVHHAGHGRTRARTHGDQKRALG